MVPSPKSKADVGRQEHFDGKNLADGKRGMGYIVVVF